MKTAFHVPGKLLRRGFALRQPKVSMTLVEPFLFSFPISQRINHKGEYTMSFSEITRKIAESLSGIFSSSQKHKKDAFKPRRLHLDPLEERQLLAVNVVMPHEQMLTSLSPHSSPTISGNTFYINSSNSYGGADYTETVWGNDYMASNNQGDTVMVWAQNDYVYRMNANGEFFYENGEKVRLTDQFGNFYDDYNIYAQYLTDQVDRVSIPIELLDNNISGINGSFKMVYAPNEIQRLSIKTVTEANFTMMGSGANVAIDFEIGGVDMNQDGVPDFYPVNGFDEYLNSPAQNAKLIENALKEIYPDITVTAESTKDFLITFGDSCIGQNMPELEVRNIHVRSGNYPGVAMSTISEPIVLTNYDSWGNEVGIVVDPSNPQLTAQRIQQAFDHVSAFSAFPRVYTYTRNVYTYQENKVTDYVDSAYRPSYDVFNVPEVNVAIVNGANFETGTTFDITFVRSAGLTVHDLILTSATDEFGTEYVTYQKQAGAKSKSEVIGVDTVKQSSEAFRVNAPEENDPMSIVPLVTNQMNPSVAMDADGDFVITWQSESAVLNNRTVTDIYARQFSPQGIVAESKINFYNDGYTTKRYYGGEENKAVQSIRPVGDQFKVNTNGGFYATAPSIGMDADGNYIIAWTTSSKSLSDGNTVYAKRYDRYSNALTDDVKVSADYNYFPLNHVSVDMSNDGYAAITWIYNEDDNFSNYSIAGPMYMSLFAPATGPDSLIAMPGLERIAIATGAYNANVAFDAQNNFVITYSDTSPYVGNKGASGSESVDVRAQMYSFTTDAAGNATFEQLRGEFLVHSLTNWQRDNYADESWRGAQLNGVGGLDADGDMVFVYQGYGPDSNEAYPIDIPGSYFASYINAYKNSDLLKFFNPAAENFTSTSSDVDVAIRNYLARAIKSADAATYEQVARLNAVFESVAGMMRGGANDIFATTIDKGVWDNTTANTAATASDANVTSTRDGVNAHYFIMIPQYTVFPVNGGTINLQIYREFFADDGSIYATGTVTVPVAIPATNNVFNPATFRTNLYAALNSQNNGYADTPFGPVLNPTYSGNSLIIPSAEVTYYEPGVYEAMFNGTIWELPYGDYSDYDDINNYHVFEIVFVGGAHDSYVGMGFGNGSNMTRYQYQPANTNFIGSAPYFAQHYGYSGAAQTTPGLSVLPTGSYVASWFTNITTTDGSVVDKKINYRYFDESSDTVGPKVTDVILPNGQYVANNATITYALDNLVITVDEELLVDGENGFHSVLNPNNWSIIKKDAGGDKGVAMNDIIESISFGVNRSRDMIDENSTLADSILSYGSNKWEVVITFSEPLTSGYYEIRALNNICDTANVKIDPRTGTRINEPGNPLGGNGTNENGIGFSRLFHIEAIDGLLTFGNGTGVSYDDTLVSDMFGDHYTRVAEGKDTPGNPTSVASDEQGNFVVVWTDENQGVRAKVYHQDFIETENGRESVITFHREFVVTSNPTATYASVAMDADGDFVVTWMQEDADGRNIYAKAYNANGSARMDSNNEVMAEFRVNSHSGGTHSYPDIAMSPNGDFVITWESLNQLKTTGKTQSGYDIFYQRYDSSCTPIGKVDEIQSIQFSGGPSAGGVFRIEFEGQLTGDIEIGTNMTITAANIQVALKALGLDVDVAAASASSVLVQFTRTMGGKDIAPLSVPTKYVKLVSPKSDQSISATTLTTGTSGEALANDTILGNQRYASIAMAQTGEFTITWTSWGQGNDSANESNIYAKNFAANAAVTANYSQVSLAERIEIMNTTAAFDKKVAAYDLSNKNLMESLGTFDKQIVSADSPDNHEDSEMEYTGVVFIYGLFSDGTYVGTGSLLTSGMHILTAAHVVFDDAYGPLAPENIIVEFVLPTGSQFYAVSQNIVHASYTGNYPVETDLAILVLSAIAPAEAERYDIYRGNNELGSEFTIVGFGTAGTGDTGNVMPAGTRRSGENKYEALGTIFDPSYNSNTLVFDFDSGKPQNDALGYYFGIYNTGLGATREVSSAGGDSGGPSFLNGTGTNNKKIAGVTSYGGPVYANSMTDAVPGTNSSFGEFDVQVRVSAYADWIDSIMTTGTSEYLVNQTETGNQIWSDVAISMSGDVVFTWTSFNQDRAGDGPGGSSNGLAGVYARRFDTAGMPVQGTIGEGTADNPIQLGDEFLVNDYIVGDQCYSSVAMANNGDFIITWESYQDANLVSVSYPDTGHGAGGPTTVTVVDYGVYAKRYTNLATLRASRDNTSDAQYGLPDNTRYVPGYGYVGIHGEIGSEFRVNKVHIIGDQTGATVAMNANGDAIVVFQGDEGEGTESKVYYRALPLGVDMGAPIVTETVAVVTVPKLDADGEIQYDNNGDVITQNAPLTTITNNSVIYGYVPQMIVTFSEEMYAAYLNDRDSIINTDNWQLFIDGISINGTIAKVEYGLDMAYECGLVGTKTGKMEAVITFDSNVGKEGDQALGSGTYTLIIKDDVTDLSDNHLDGDYSGFAGGNFSRVFYIVAPTSDDTSDDDDGDNNSDPVTPDENVYIKTEFGNDTPVIASDKDGSFVVASVRYGMPGTPNEPMHASYLFDANGIPVTAGGDIDKIGNIVIQRYDANGKKIGTEKIVNDHMEGLQHSPDIAMDSYGNFAVVWAGDGELSRNAIHIMIYDSYGNAVLNHQLQVNTDNNAKCSTPKVAYDDAGNILVTWVDLKQGGQNSTIMYRVYNSNGNPISSQGILIPENLHYNSVQNYDYDIACDPSGNVVVTWQMTTETNGQDIFAQVFKFANANGTLTATTPKFVVNQYTTGVQNKPSVAMSAVGTFVISWTSANQDGDNFGIFARRFSIDGTPLPILGKTGDVNINTYTVGEQHYSNVSMAPNGNFVVTWSSKNQEPDNFDRINGVMIKDYGTFARAFNSNGDNLVASYAPSSSKEFRLNNTIARDQKYSVVAIHDNGMSFAWISQVDGEYITEYDATGVPIAGITFQTVDVFTRTYTVKSNISSDLSGYSASYVASYSQTQPVGGGGYAGQGTATYKYENLETLFLDGTAGDDVFEIIVSASGAIQMKINGKAQTVGSQVKDVQINGLAGNDKIILTTINGDNTARINVGENRLAVTANDGSFTISALKIEGAELNLGGLNNAINVVAGANDVLTTRVGQLSLVGDNHAYYANGFDYVTASATDKSAKAFLYDSVGNDTLTMSLGKAVMKGEGFEHTVSGFGTISGYSNQGNDIVTMEGSAGNDAVFASGNVVSMTSSVYKNTASGFVKSYIMGNGGIDTVAVVGSNKTDRFTGTTSYAEVNFGIGGVSSLYGFSNFNVMGNGGNDVISLSGVSLASSGSKTATYSSKSQTYQVTGFKDIRVTQEEMVAASVVTSQNPNSATTQDVYTMPATPKVIIQLGKVVDTGAVQSMMSSTSVSNEDDLLQLLAEEHHNNFNNQNADDDDDNTLDIDYLLKIGAL